MNKLSYTVAILLLNFVVIQSVQGTNQYEAAKNGNLDFLKQFIANGGDINDAKVITGFKIKHIINHNQYSSDNPKYRIYLNYAYKNLGKGYSYSSAAAIASIAQLEQMEIEEENRNNFLQTPLVVAIMHKQNEAAKFIINAGADFGVFDNMDRLPIHYASYYGMKDIVELLIERSIKVNEETNINVKEESKLNRTPLLMSLYGGSTRNIETVLFLINNDAGVNETDKLGKSPLLLAAQDNNLEIVKALLGKGADVNVTDENNIFPLAYAVLLNNLEMTKYLVEKGADTNKLHKGSNLLALAALGPDHSKQTLMPSTSPTTNGSSAIIEYLISKNIDINDGIVPPLHMAILSNDITNVKYLISKGASVAKSLDSGNERSSMHQAAFKNRLEIAKILIQHKAKINSVDDNGYKPSDYALRYGFHDFLELLKGYGG